jgi:hypothetical protein
MPLVKFEAYLTFCQGGCLPFISTICFQFKKIVLKLLLLVLLHEKKKKNSQEVCHKAQMQGIHKLT